MATLESIKIYANGAVATSNHIGMYGSTQYERVYGIKIGSGGATSITVTLAYSSNPGGATQHSYCLVNESDACVAPRLNPQVSGSTAAVINTSTQTFTYTVTGEFLPGAVYYFHIWSEGSSGNYRYIDVRQEITGDNCRTAVSESGSYGGLARVYTANGWKSAIPYVYTENGWKRAAAYVYTANGWKMGV